MSGFYAMEAFDYKFFTSYKILSFYIWFLLTSHGSNDNYPSENFGFVYFEPVSIWALLILHTQSSYIKLHISTRENNESMESKVDTPHTH